MNIVFIYDLFVQIRQGVAYYHEAVKSLASLYGLFAFCAGSLCAKFGGSISGGFCACTHACA
jgi:hypothetical protein